MRRWMLIRLLSSMRGCVEGFFVSVLFSSCVFLSGSPYPFFMHSSSIFSTSRRQLSSTLAITIRMLAT